MLKKNVGILQLIFSILLIGIIIFNYVFNKMQMQQIQTTTLEEAKPLLTLVMFNHQTTIFIITIAIVAVLLILNSIVLLKENQ